MVAVTAMGGLRPAKGEDTAGNDKAPGLAVGKEGEVGNGQG